MKHRQTTTNNNLGFIKSKATGGYILLTLLFVLVSASTLFFVSNPSKKYSSTADYKELETIKKTVLSRAMSSKGSLTSTIIYPGINDYPGTLPCPESLADGTIGTADEGEEKKTCHNVSEQKNYIGRLAWRALGISDVNDSQGSRFWYVINNQYTKDTSGAQDHKKLNSDFKANPPMYWAEDGVNKGEEIVAIVFAPQKPQTGQNRKSSYSSTDLPDFNNYIEIVRETTSTPTEEIIVRRRTQKCVDEFKCADGIISNDLVITISKTEWQDAIQKRVGETMLYCINKFRKDNTKPIPPNYNHYSATAVREFSPADKPFEFASLHFNFAPELNLYDRYPQSCFSGCTAACVSTDTVDDTVFYSSANDINNSNCSSCSFQENNTYNSSLALNISHALVSAAGDCGELLTLIPRYPKSCFKYCPTGCNSSDGYDSANYYNKNDLSDYNNECSSCEFKKNETYSSTLSGIPLSVTPSSMPNSKCEDFMLEPPVDITITDDICENLFNRYENNSISPAFTYNKNTDFNKLYIPDGDWDKATREMYPYCNDCKNNRWGAQWVNTMFPAYASNSCKTEYDNAIADGTVSATEKVAIESKCLKVETENGCQISDTVIIFPNEDLNANRIPERPVTPLFPRGNLTNYTNAYNSYKTALSTSGNPEWFFEGRNLTSVTTPITDPDHFTFEQKKRNSNFNDAVFFNSIGRCPE